MFLGRIEPIKGVKEAVEVSIKSGQKLLIAGNISEGHEKYFKSFVEPFLNTGLIEYVGPVNDLKKKLEYLQKASSLLFPINLKTEAFGIVMIEAMACGVPVIAFNIGPVPEVVKNGVTGFIVDNVEEMIDAVHQINKIDRNIVREICLKRFSQKVIAEQYIFLLTWLSSL